MIIRLAALLATTTTVAADGPRTVAVLEIRNRLPATERSLVEAGFFSDEVRGAVLEVAPGLRVMTRENLMVLLSASGKSLDECEGECEVDTGRRLGADYVVSGEIYKIGASLRLTLRLHDTRGGNLLPTAQSEGTDAALLDPRC